MLIKLINMLPSCMAGYMIRKLLDCCFYISEFQIFVENFWLKYYLKKLKRTGDYYKTLNTLNSNKFCPVVVNSMFIEASPTILNS